MIARTHPLRFGAGILVIGAALLATPAWPAAPSRLDLPVRKVTTRAPAPAKVATPTQGVGVTVRVISGPPQVYGTWLAQNFPTAFSSWTVIRYSLSSGSKVSIMVYSVTGQKVATLVNGYQNAGVYSLNWSGRGDDGNPLAPGVYLYQMNTPRKSFSKKMVLIR